MKLVLTISFLFLTSLGHSKALTAAAALSKIEKAYSQRLDDNGELIEDDELAETFNQLQNKLILELKNNNLIGHSFTITNSVKTDVIMTVSAVIEKNGSLAGVMIESSRYKDLAAEANLRAINLRKLRTGMDAVVFEGSTVARIKSEETLNSESGGLLNIDFPLNFKKEEFDTVKLVLLKSMDSKFAFYQEDRSTFSSVYLDVWFNIFTKNFGITSLTFE